MANPEEMKDEVKKESIEDKQKNASDRFLKLMKKKREDENIRKEREQKKETIQKLDTAIDVSGFVTKLSKFFSKVLNKVNMWIDTMLATTRRIRILSLFIALILCYFVNGGTGIATTKSIDYIDNVPVKILVGEDYEVTGAPETVTVQLIGDYASIQWAKVMKNFSVVLDAQDKEPGDYKINYRQEGFSSALDVKIMPETANINISEKQTRSFALNYMFVNQQEMDNAFTLKKPLLAFLEVDVTAGETTLNRIDKVVAKIDVKDIKQSIVNGEAPIVALDANGNELKVKFDQSIVKYDLEVVSYSKTVPIRLETIGDVNSEYVLTSLKPSIDTVTIYGLEEHLKDITEVVASVDVDGKTSNSTISGVAITLPEHVTKLSDKVISVDIEVEKKISKDISDIQITLESLPTNLRARLLEQTTATIKVTGAESKIKALNKDNLKVYVDLSDASTGTATYELKIANRDPNISYDWVSATSVDIAITED